MRWGALATLVLAIATSGCGGGDGGASATTGGATSTAAPTRAAYIAQADAICRRTNERTAGTNEQIAEINRRATSTESALAQAAPILAEAYRSQRASVAEFRALPAPAGDAAAVDRVVAGIEEQVALIGRIADAADAGDAARMRALSAELKLTRARVRGLLQGYGFRVCGSR